MCSQTVKAPKFGLTKSSVELWIPTPKPKWESLKSSNITLFSF